ncbi:MAG: hypothetical protein ACFB0C_04340 [Leptolyngbyaceae cyanobacterium]
MASANCYGSLEGLLWVEPLLVSNSGLDKRFCKIPAALFTQLLSQVQQQLATRPSGAELSEPWQALQQRFSAIWIADGSTLAARWRLRCGNRWSEFRWKWCFGDCTQSSPLKGRHD